MTIVIFRGDFCQLLLLFQWVCLVESGFNHLLTLIFVFYNIIQSRPVVNVPIHHKKQLS